MPRAAARPYRREIQRLLGLALAAALLAPASAARADTPPAPVQDLLPGASSSGPHDLTAYKGSVYFSASDAGGFGLWRSDGNGIASLMRTDAGAGFTVAGDTLYFAASDPDHGVELWKTDGAAPTRVKDLEPGTGSSGPRSLAAVGSTLYFNAFTTAGGWQLWRTGGGDPVPLHAFGFEPLRSLTAVGSLLFFVSANELWRSDGTSAGTVKVAGAGAAPSSLTAFAGKLYFAASDDAHGSELWKADAAGASLVKDIWAGQDGSAPRYLAVLGGNLYFAAEDTRGRELWRSDGTDATLVADIETGPASSDPRWITTVSSRLIFEAHDPVHGRALWRSDGAGASLLADINPTGDASIAPSGDLPPGAPERLVVAGGSAFFQAGDEPSGTELWRSDGTTAARVADINPRADSSQPEGIVQAGSRLFFSAQRPDIGTELWSFVLGAAADVSVSLSAAPDRPRVGEQTTVTVTARNHGPEDTAGVRVGVTLPPGMTLERGAAGEWMVGALAKGQSKTLQLVVTVTGASPAVSARVLASDLPDQTAANDLFSLVLAPPEIVVGPACDLVSAIVAANTDAPAGMCPAGRGADTIVLPAGSTQGLAVAYENADGATGLPSITSDITILGNGATIAPAAGAPDFRLVRVAANGVLALRDLRVRGGSASVRGGAIFVAGGRLSMENATVEDSISPNGGGLAALNGTVSLRLVTVRNNTANTGGGIYTEGGSLELTDAVVSGNRATHPTATTFGGGIYTSSALTVTRGVITGNSAFDGGGVLSSGPSTLTDVTVSGNAASGGFGGIDNRGVMTLVRGAVSANTAGDVGGGIGNQFSGAGSLRVTGAQITGNKAGAGGGGGIASYGPLTIESALVSGNAGGGLFNTGPASIVSSTFSGNAIANSGGLTVLAATIVGGGISGAGTSTVTGSIVSGCAGAVVDGGGNVGCLSAVDPKLGPLADNGGPTFTHLPLPGSPAIDAGAATCPAFDQRGAARPLGRCDAGAVEAGVAPVVVAAKIIPKVTGLPKKLVASGLTVTLGNARNPPTASTVQTLTLVGAKARAAVVLARGSTRIPAGKSRRVTVTLKKRLRKTVKVRLRIVATSPDGTKATITRTLKLTRRR